MRPEQVAMATDVERTLLEGEIALIEAGTGIGKSMAYLVPAMMSGRRTVVSTHTISLQQQLIDKDIPALLKALGLKQRAVLMKGMGNYLCLRRLDDAFVERHSLGVEEREEVEAVREWAEENERGSLSDLPTFPSRLVRERIRMEGDSCSHSLCPHYKRCLFFRARREAEEADLLIVNHHLLLADLALRMEGEGEGAILPDYDHLIIDEAHHLEEVATTTFAERVSRRDVERIFHRLQGEGRGLRRLGRLDLLADKVWKGEGDPEIKLQLQQKIEVVLPAERRSVQEQLHHLFAKLSNFFEQEGWLRLRAEHLEMELWSEEIQPQCEIASENLRRYAQSLRALCADVEGWSDEERLRSLRFDVGVLAGRLERVAGRLDRFAFDEIDLDHVRWIERPKGEVLLSAAQLDISELLARWLFARVPSVVLSSATLATHRRFRFCRKRLGLDSELLEERVVTEKIYDSPFDYEGQTMLLVPTDLPDPDDRNFPAQAIERIWDALEASEGNAFVLFTSYRMLHQCEVALAPRLKEGGYSLFCQGSQERHTLLAQFRETPKAVLFGTDSFWEGVDVAGDALRCVVLTKLPFRVPTEPIVEAQIDRILANGGRPFIDYTLPQAIVKFKQGFGRLIRNQSDRGCILCLDSRLIRKPYGRAFLGSLPASPLMKGKREEITGLLQTFYGA